MNKKSKITLIIIILVVFFLGLAIAYRHYSSISEANAASKIKANEKNKITKAEIKSDVNEMIEIMEKTHPFFILEGETEKYKEAKAKFLVETNKSMSKEDFRISVCKYLSSIEDGHTRVSWEDMWWLNVNWKYINGKLVILDGNNKATDEVITKINKVDIQKIFKTINELFPAENDAAVSENYAIYSRSKEVLTYSGVDCSKGISLTVSNKNSKENIKVIFLKNIQPYPQSNEISSRKIDDNTIYVKLGSCQLNDALDKVLENLKQAINSGTKNVIIDVMDNPGGNSDACYKLLDSLKIKPGEFGGVIRYSPLAQKQRGYKNSSGYEEYDSKNNAIPNLNINLYVITNEETFSSAQWLATWVKDGKLGTIVGRPSSNMPSSYGNILSFDLKYSKLNGQISYIKWNRPDKTKDNERELEPDVYVDYSENALDKIRELITEKR